MVGIPPWAADYIGAPFEDHGRTIDGVDCWGLARLIWAEHAGLDVPSYAAEYGDASDGIQVEAAIRGQGIDGGRWREIPEDAERLFDAVHMKGYVTVDGMLRRVAMHVGLVLAPGVLIHVERGIGAALGHYRSDRRLVPRVLGFYRHERLDTVQ